MQQVADAVYLLPKLGRAGQGIDPFGRFFFKTRQLEISPSVSASCSAEPTAELSKGL